MEKFNERLKRLKDEHNFTYAYLCKKLDVSRRCLIMWINGDSQPSVDKIYKLCEIFGVNSDYLLCLSNEKIEYVKHSFDEDKIIVLDDLNDVQINRIKHIIDIYKLSLKETGDDLKNGNDN